MPPAPSAPDALYLAFQSAVAGRYSIDRELGRGGMGVVYLAREVHLDRLIAIKLLPPEKAALPGLRDRFLREARLAAKLSHPHIIPIHAVDDVEGFVFYVMSFVDGETLAQRVRSRGPLSSSEGARVLRECAWALAYAHSHGLVHRDVKPDNILLETSSGRALVADFGIAAAAGALDSDGVAGTPEFMSPEQAMGQDLDARSDLYSLGATAFYAFSGRLPFEGTSATEVLAKQVMAPAPALASLGLSVPRKLASLIDRCLAKDPNQRPDTADVLAEQLGVALEQRRELPAALRSFVKRSGRMDGGGTVLFAAALLAGSIGVSAAVGVVEGFTAFFSGAILAPLAFGVGSALRLSKMGFSQADLLPAYQAELDNSREERAADQDRGRGLLHRVVGTIARVSLSFTGVAIPVLMGASALGQHAMVNAASAVVISMALVGAASGVLSLAMLQSRRDIDTEFWRLAWLGRYGKLAFGIARRIGGARRTTSPMTHRATELSLGLAAEQLYEALPKATQKQLGDLPTLLQRLQQDAQLLRQHYDGLQDALNQAGADASSEAYADVRHDRDLLRMKLGEAVGALETIRLSLLRLHAGSGSIEGLTTHIGLAVAVSDEVERLIAAQDEVERGLAFPREIEATPV